MSDDTYHSESEFHYPDEILNEIFQDDEVENNDNY